MSTGFLFGSWKCHEIRLYWWLYNFEYTKEHWTLHFKQMSCMTCELYLNNAFKKTWYWIEICHKAFIEKAWLSYTLKNGGKSDWQTRGILCMYVFILHFLLIIHAHSEKIIEYWKVRDVLPTCHLWPQIYPTSSFSCMCVCIHSHVYTHTHIYTHIHTSLSKQYRVRKSLG